MEKNPIPWIKKIVGRQSFERLDGSALADAVDKDLRSQNSTLARSVEELTSANPPLYLRVSNSIATKAENIADSALEHRGMIGFVAGGVIFLGIGFSMGSCHEREKNYPVPFITSTQIRRENTLPPRSTRPVIERTPQNSR